MKKFYWLLIFLTSLAEGNALGFGSEEMPDSTDIVRWNQEALSLIYSDPDKAMEIAQKATIAAYQTGFLHGEIRALIRIGIIYDVQSKNEKSLIAYQRALVLSQKSHDYKAAASCLSNMGLIYLKTDRLSLALDHFYRAYAIFRQIKDEENMAFVSNNIGLIHNELTIPQSALFWFRKSLSHHERAKTPSANIFDVYANLASLFNWDNNTDSAIYYANLAINGFRKNNNLYGLAKMLGNTGIYFHETGQYEWAIRYFEEAMEIDKRLKNDYSYVVSGYYLSRTYKTLKRYPRQMEVLHDIYPLSKELQSSEFLYRICLDMAESSFRQGLFKDGEKYLNEFKRAHRAYYAEALNKNLAETEKRFETEEGRRKILLLENQNMVQELKVKNQNGLLLVLSFLFVGGMLSGVIFFQRTRNKQREKQATAVLKEKDKGLKAIIEAQEIERATIARELHDGIGNQLIALKMNMTTGNKEVAHRLVQELMDEVRHVSHQMMPKTLQEFGCTTAIKDMLRKTLGAAGIKYFFETHNTRKRYRSEIEITVFRAAQEMINNIIRHAQAQTVDVQLFESQNKLIMIIEDDGKGLQEAEIYQNGLGFRSIKTRVGAINGQISIFNGDYCGTVATIRIPIS